MLLKDKSQILEAMMNDTKDFPPDAIQRYTKMFKDGQSLVSSVNKDKSKKKQNSQKSPLR